MKVSAEGSYAEVSDKEYEEIVAQWLTDPAERDAHIAQWMWYCGYPEDACKRYERAIARCEQEHGPDHPLLLDCLTRLTLVEQERGRQQRAEELLGQAVALAQRICAQPPGDVAQIRLGEGHNVPDVLSLLAWLALEMGQTEETRALVRWALAIAEQVPADAGTDLSAAYHNVAGVLAQLGEVEGARELYQRLLESGERPYEDLAELERRAGRLSEAREWLERAQEAFEGEHNVSPWHRANVCRMLGEVEHDLGHVEDARGWLRSALAVLDDAGQGDDIEVPGVLRSLAQVEKRLGYREEASDLRRRAYDLLRQQHGRYLEHYGSDYGLTQEMAEELAELEREMVADPRTPAD